MLRRLSHLGQISKRVSLRSNAFNQASVRMFTKDGSNILPENGTSASDVKSDIETPESEPVSQVDEVYQKAVADLDTAEVTIRKLHGELLLKYADAENVRRERASELKKRDLGNIKVFGGKTGTIFESLDKVCTTANEKAAKSDDEKVKSLAEGLSMTRDIMKNILEKHNIA